jgi:PAS domain S-box-containing protein
MAVFRDTPIKRKLTLVTMLTSGAALVLACVVFVAHDLFSFRDAIVQEHTARARVIAANSASALVFKFPDAASDTLKTLASDPQLLRACVYDRDGRYFAGYVREGHLPDSPWPAPRPAEHEFDGDRLNLFEEVTYKGDRLGTIYLQSDLRHVNDRFKRFGGIALVVLVVSSLFAWLVSGRLQKLVSTPLLHLVDIAHGIAVCQDYSLRAEKRSNDETGLLIDAFNKMLAQIEERDAKLKEANLALERRVLDRTAELRRELQERQRADQALRQSQQQYEGLVDSIDGIVWEADATTWRFTFVSNQAANILGYTTEEWTASPSFWSDHIHPDDRSWATNYCQVQTAQKRAHDFTYRMIHKDGHIVWIRDIVTVVVEHDKPVKLRGVMMDVTEAKEAEEALREAEERQRHSQKLEAVGRLAGGVAHDFNNILTVITGYCELMLRQAHPDDPIRRQLDEVHRAADRAASLTRQLLAFSRKQVLQPQALDLNQIVTGMEKMLRRLIGEDIELRTSLAPDIGAVEADPGQIEQVILNLTVNGRDAMPTGGQLTVHTANVTMDPDTLSTDGNGTLTPGDYVMFSVSDTGVGMSTDVQAHLFEPFFTTKGIGKGTGLGLATCYGIVKQSNGDIRVYTEPGYGTTFKVYLPRIVKPQAEQAAPRAADTLAPGRETVLVVEDEPALRELATMVLSEAGYTVLEAGDGRHALDVVAQHREDKIDLMVTDVIMPNLGGKELADRMKVIRPECKVLFISGYTDDALAHHGILGNDLEFLEKPFSPVRFTHKVREVLDKRSPVSPG